MTARPYRILVTGSRDWDDTDAVCRALGEAVQEIPPHTRDIWLVVGDCPTGADRIAYQWARAARMTVDRFEADWAAHGRAAGPRRNAEMVTAGADLCLAFIRNGSRGASHTAALARRAGIPVRLWTEP
ncbi:SLOG family protein [Streptomyces sp. NPDC127040]|uniref:SLOG family protein n=1 Tax=Streptomyces sp. NPDC127040 TaxID=3347116 RepID=UPI00365101CE